MLIVVIVVAVTGACVGFIGVGIVGMLIWVIANKIELDAPACVSVSELSLRRRVQPGAQHRSEERAAVMADRLLSLQSIRFYRYLGAASFAVGIAGFTLFQI
jgi:hypothetical protein